MPLDVQGWASIVTAIGVIVGGVVAVFRFFILRPLVRLIDDRTKQIQPNANGGQSLNDLHIRMNKLEDTQKQILEIVTKPRRIPRKVSDE